MRLLVLGGTRFVGRCVVEEGVRRGDEVTTVNRGVTGGAADGVREIHADRRDNRALGDALGDGEWDAVVDTWSGAPVVAGDPASGSGDDYALAKRGAEVAVLQTFPEALLARAG